MSRLFKLTIVITLFFSVIFTFASFYVISFLIGLLKTDKSEIINYGIDIPMVWMFLQIVPFCLIPLTAFAGIKFQKSNRLQDLFMNYAIIFICIVGMAFLRVLIIRMFVETNHRDYIPYSLRVDQLKFGLNMSVGLILGFAICLLFKRRIA